MPIRTESKSGVLLLHIEDEMTIYTAADLHSQLLPHLAQPADLEIDLSQVAELDCAGLQLLILAKREATRLGGTCVCAGTAGPCSKSSTCATSRHFLATPW